MLAQGSCCTSTFQSAIGLHLLQLPLRASARTHTRTRQKKQRGNAPTDCWDLSPPVSGYCNWPARLRKCVTAESRVAKLTPVKNEWKTIREHLGERCHTSVLNQTSPSVCVCVCEWQARFSLPSSVSHYSFSPHTHTHTYNNKVQQNPGWWRGQTVTGWKKQAINPSHSDRLIACRPRPVAAAETPRIRKAEGRRRRRF